MPPFASAPLACPGAVEPNALTTAKTLTTAAKCVRKGAVLTAVVTARTALGFLLGAALFKPSASGAHGLVGRSPALGLGSWVLLSLGTATEEEQPPR